MYLYEDRIWPTIDMMAREHPALSFGRASSRDYSNDTCFPDASRAMT